MIFGLENEMMIVIGYSLKDLLKHHYKPFNNILVSILCPHHQWRREMVQLADVTGVWRW